MMNNRPEIYLSNWSSHKTPGHHGRGRRLSIMRKPRRPFQWGDGTVDVFRPPSDLLEQAQRMDISFDEYCAELRRLWAHPNAWNQQSAYAPGRLFWVNRLEQISAVKDGDTLCCSCARGTSTEPARCHRVVVAEFLHAAGWRVILDGNEWGA